MMKEQAAAQGRREAKRRAHEENMRLAHEEAVARRAAIRLENAERHARHQAMHAEYYANYHPFIAYDECPLCQQPRDETSPCAKIGRRAHDVLDMRGEVGLDVAGAYGGEE